MLFSPPPASRQIAFHERLVSARTRWLAPALAAAVQRVPAAAVSAEIAQFVGASPRQLLAHAGIRDEYVFPVPTVLVAAPMLVGYYRLLLGRPQKSFYGEDGFGVLKSMETVGTLSPSQRKALPAACTAWCSALAELVMQLSPTVTPEDIAQLPLLTLGSQFQGGANNVIGKQATHDVFTSILSIIPPSTIQSQTAVRVVFRNQAGRLVSVTVAADPDVRVEEQDPATEQWFAKLAIEIKGGTDRSNAHNRAGEAEKSHQKAKSRTGGGFAECWTVISTKGVSLAKLQAESPSTNHFFDTAEILARSGADWATFAARLRSSFGI